MTDPIKAKIIELVPEIVEPRFGCSFVVKKQTPFEDLGIEEGDYISLFDWEFDSQSFLRPKKFRTALYVHKSEGAVTDYKNPKVVTVADFDSLLKNGNIEILGRPITLTDVLRAIGSLTITTRGDEALKIDTLGNMEYYHSGDIMPGWEIAPVKWNLTTDYDGQTQEVKEFIGKLLGV